MKKKTNKKRDFESSEFVKTMGMTLDHYLFIDSKRKQKSRAGFLKKIIEFYINKNKDL